jgi:hypothetical protein
MSKDHIIRDTAYALWEAEGRPDGRSEYHWALAESQVEAQVSSSASQGEPVTGAEADAQVAAGGAPKKTRSRVKKPGAEVVAGGD